MLCENAGVDVRELAVGHFYVGQGDATGRSEAEGVAVDGFDLHFASGAEIQHH